MVRIQKHEVVPVKDRSFEVYVVIDSFNKEIYDTVISESDHCTIEGTFKEQTQHSVTGLPQDKEFFEPFDGILDQVCSMDRFKRVWIRIE